MENVATWTVGVDVIIKATARAPFRMGDFADARCPWYRNRHLGARAPTAKTKQTKPIKKQKQNKHPEDETHRTQADGPPVVQA